MRRKEPHSSERWWKGLITYQPPPHLNPRFGPTATLHHNHIPVGIKHHLQYADDLTVRVHRVPCHHPTASEAAWVSERGIWTALYTGVIERVCINSNVSSCADKRNFRNVDVRNVRSSK